MKKDKSFFIAEYFKKWDQDTKRAESLLASDQYFLEGLLVLSCYIGALGKLRYPKEEHDWKSYKTIVWEYSLQKEIYGNIDLLFFYQWPKLKLPNGNVYEKINNYSELVNIFKSEFGDDTVIKSNPRRYQKREELVGLVKSRGIAWFDKNNFEKYIELFSNNQILYHFLRCEAVHNMRFPLFNPVYSLEQGQTTYENNHQINRDVILATVKNIVAGLGEECIGKIKWPGEL